MGPSERIVGDPEEPVVADEEVDAAAMACLERELTGIDGGADFADASVVFDLQAVVARRRSPLFRSGGCVRRRS